MSKTEYIGILVISVLFSYLFWGHTFGVSMLIFTAVVVAIVLHGKMNTVNTKNLYIWKEDDLKDKETMAVIK